MEKNQIILLNKIQNASIELNQPGVLKKEGKGYKHTYFRTEDIIPKILEVCKKYKIMYHPELDKGKITMVDLDEPYGTLEYTLPVKIKKVIDDNEKNVQLVGKKQTYYKRYLLIQIFDICETDEIELVDPDKNTKKNPRKQVINNKIKTTPMNETEFQEMTKIVEKNSKFQQTDKAIDILYNMGKFNKEDKTKLLNYFQGGVTI